MNWSDLPPQIVLVPPPQSSLPKSSYGALNNRSAPGPGTNKSWFYEVKSGWRLFDAQQQADLDANARNGSTLFQINIKGIIYEINLTSWKQINITNRKKTRKIKQDFANGASGNWETQSTPTPPTRTPQPPLQVQPEYTHYHRINVNRAEASPIVQKWMYQGNTGWDFYDDASNSIIDSNFLRGESECTIRINGVGYRINFETMTQINYSVSSKMRRVKRCISNNQNPLSSLSVATIISSGWFYMWHPVKAIYRLLEFFRVIKRRLQQ